jgi:hypothetical protein
MIQADALAWWDSLRHGGLFIAPVRLQQYFYAEPEILSFRATEVLRRALTSFSPTDTPSRTILLDTILEYVCGLRGDKFTWRKGKSNVEQKWLLRSVTGDNTKPDRTLDGPNGAFLPVFLTDETRIGVGRGRRPISRVLEWLRNAGRHLALLTNGRQWRLMYAGLDHDAWVEWDSELFFEQGVPGPQVQALRTLLSPQSLTPAKEGEPCPLLAAIQDSRKGQAELSANLGERVRTAVEWLIRSYGDQLAALPAGVDTRNIYHAATRIVMRMVVILFAEARELLPRDNPIYHQSYGLEGLYEQLVRVPRERLRNQHAAWPRILALFRLVFEGSHHEALPVTSYRGGLFERGDKESADPLSQALAAFEDASKAPSDWTILEMLRLLTRSEVFIRQGRARKRAVVPVNFADLSSEYIGILYEGLLDYELRRVEHDPIIFLNLGDQPALPLSRLEEMDDKAIENLVEKMKVKKAAATAGDEEGDETEDEPDAEEQEDEPEDDEDPEVDTEQLPEDEQAGATEPPDETSDQARESALQRAYAWARRAVEAAGIVKKPRGKLTPEKKQAFESELERATRQTVVKLILPGEWFLVRWGGTRKGAGTFYTRPQLAVPTTQRTLRPLAFNPPAGDPDAPPHEWTPKKPEEILALKVCDPAMGSGSFPVAALRFLTDALYQSLHHHGRISARGSQSVITLAEGQPTQAGLSEELLPSLPDSEDFEPRLRARLKRYVVERCIYGVDIDPLAVELARLALWVETMDRSLPFEFLDHKLKCGNALVGCWFDQFRDYPIMAWKREAGDKNHNGVHFAKGTGEKAIKEKFKQVKASLETWLRDVVGAKPRVLFEVGANPEKLVEAARNKLAAIHAIPLHEPDRKAEAYRALQSDAAYQRLKQAFDVWCAIWFWPTDKLADAITPLHFFSPGASQRATAHGLRQQYRFFHWELEFPDVFSTQNAVLPAASSTGGFSAVLGNPPWETLQPSSKEYFSNVDPLYRSYGKQEALTKQKGYFQAKSEQESDWLAYLAHFKALTHYTKWSADPWGYNVQRNGKAGYSFGTSAAKKQLANAWEQRRSRHQGFADPAHPFRLQRAAVDVDSDDNSGEKKSKRSASKAYTYRLFLESALAVLRMGGRLGFVVPSGLYTDEGSTTLRRHILDQCQWEWLFGFENRDGIFDIHRSFKFCPIIVQKGGRTEAIKAAFMRRDLSDWEQSQPQHLPYAREQVTRFSPNTFAILELRNRRDLEILEKIYANSVLLGDTSENGWGIKYQQGDFNMTSDSALFPPRPKWEAKGYQPDEYGRWILGPWRAREGSREAPTDAPRHTLPQGLLLSQDGRMYLHETEIQNDPDTGHEGVALPLYEGRMIDQFDFSAKGWVSGKGRSAVWREVPWSHKAFEPQYLMGIADYLKEHPHGRRPKLAIMDVTASTNTRTVIASMVYGAPCGHKTPTLTSPVATVREISALTAIADSLVFDYLIRLRIGGNSLIWSFLADTPLPHRVEQVDEALAIHACTLNAATLAASSIWLQLVQQDVPWQSSWALSEAERLRKRVLVDCVVASYYGLQQPDLLDLLEGCSFPRDSIADKAFRRTLYPKGFWRVDKDKDPELRHTVLTLVAFHDLQQRIRNHGGDLEKGIESFCSQNDGQGWMLPETLRLADYGLGHDDRAKRHQPVAERLGPRFYDWQLTQSPEESWQECHLHARNILGEQGYQQLLKEIAAKQEPTNARDAPGSSPQSPQIHTDQKGQKTAYPKPQKDMFGKS